MHSQFYICNNIHFRHEKEHFAKEQFSEESRLVAYLQERYVRAGKVARPVKNSSQTLRIEFALVLIQILDFDETNQVLTTNTWKRYVSMIK